MNEIKGIEHDNVLRLIDAKTIDSKYALIYESGEGDLQSLIKKKEFG